MDAFIEYRKTLDSNKKFISELIQSASSALVEVHGLLLFFNHFLVCDEQYKDDIDFLHLKTLLTTIFNQTKLVLQNFINTGALCLDDETFLSNVSKLDQLIDTYTVLSHDIQAKLEKGE